MDGASQQEHGRVQGRMALDVRAALLGLHVMNREPGADFRPVRWDGDVENRFDLALLVPEFVPA